MARGETREERRKRRRRDRNTASPLPDEFFARGRMAAGFVAAPLLVFMLPLIGLYLVVMILLLETLVR